MKLKKYFLEFCGSAALFGIAILALTYVHPVFGESDAASEKCIAATPTPVSEGGTDNSRGKQEKWDVKNYTKEKEKAVEEILNSYDWTGREEERELFRQELLECDEWEVVNMLE